VRDTSFPSRFIVPVNGLPAVVSGGIETGIVPSTMAAPGVFRFANVMVKAWPGGGGLVSTMVVGKFPNRPHNSPAQSRWALTNKLIPKAVPVPVPVPVPPNMTVCVFVKGPVDVPTCDTITSPVMSVKRPTGALIVMSTMRLFNWALPV
jgi:hypothetical protein